MAGNCEKMLDYYPLLIESAIDFKIESRKILAQHNGKFDYPVNINKNGTHGLDYYFYRRGATNHK